METIAARMVYGNAREAVQRAFPGVDMQRVKMTQSYLRVEQPMQVGVSQIKFPILINEPNNSQLGFYKTEKRLNLQDSFVVSEIKFYLATPTSDDDTIFRPLTYNNPVAFGANTAAVAGYYNGYMSIAVNNNVLVPAWDLDRHYYSPETQATASAAEGSPVDQYDGNRYSFYPMEPNVIFVGSKNNDVQIVIPNGITAFPANARIGLWFRGVLVQNSTVVS